MGVFLVLNKPAWRAESFIRGAALLGENHLSDFVLRARLSPPRYSHQVPPPLMCKQARL